MTEPRQRVVRVPGARRAKLTPVAGTDTDPEVVHNAPPRVLPSGGPNDADMLREVPPHY